MMEKERLNAVLSEKASSATLQIQEATEIISSLRQELQIKIADISRLGTSNDQLAEKLENQKKELNELQAKFAVEFENLANRIFKQHNQEFIASSEKNIGGLLDPLKEKLQSFEKKVQEVYETELRDKSSLKQEVKNLFELNRKLSEDAENLTKALTGDSQKQGSWGEVILERILERSGLTKGSEYEIQLVTRDEHGQLIRPDVVINLPDSKHIIIDSKVSLMAYEQFMSSGDAVERERFMQMHVESIKTHTKGLAEKNYQLASAFNSPDFVLLFLPIESALSAALQYEPELFSFAWERKIVIVSPTTLLATLKTVASIWKQEKQTQNALEIARQGGNLYDKFVSFVSDLERLGQQLSSLQKTYDEAHKKLSSGSGNLISRSEKLRKLGAKSSKVLPSQYLFTENDENDEEEFPDPPTN